MPIPTTAGELQQYIATMQWLKSKLPGYNKIIAPLQEILNACLKGTKRTKSQATKIALSRHGWGPEHVKSFKESKKMLLNAVEVAHVDDDKHLCLFCDASDKHFGAALTQIPPADIAKPVHEQQHEPLEFLSGTFRGACSRWSINCKEAWAIIWACRRLRSYLLRPKVFTIYCDPNNLKYIFDPSTTRVNASKSTMDRLSRWSWEISALPYKFVILPGTANVVADLLSRWGAGCVKTKKTQAQACSIKEHTSGSDGDTEPEVNTASPVKFSSKRKQSIHARLHEPSTIYEVPHPFEWPCFGDIADAQSKLSKSELQGAQLNDDGIWMNKGLIVLPIADMELISRVCIVAHAGSAGHRGITPTLRAIKRRFTFTDMPKIVKRFVQRCLQCLKSTSGKKIPLMFGHQILPKVPGDVIHLDHLYMQKRANQVTNIYWSLRMVSALYVNW